MEPIRLGLVGAGLIWDNAHRPALESLGDGAFRVTACAARSEATRAKVAGQYPGAAACGDYRDLVQRDDVDAVVVLTPIALNAAVAGAALAAGKDVILEKPIARTLAEGEALTEQAARSGRRVAVLEQSAYRATYEVIRDRIRDGAIGEPILYDQATHTLFDAQEHSSRGYGTTAWRRQPDFPLGTLFDGGHHQIAALSVIFGPPVEVTAVGRQLRPEYGEYDHVLMYFGYAGGLHGVFTYSEYLGGGRNYFHVRGTEGLLSIEEGRLVHCDREGRCVPVPVPQEWPHARMWQTIAAWLHGEPIACYDVRDGLRDLRILDAIARSAHAGGTRVEI